MAATGNDGFDAFSTATFGRLVGQLFLVTGDVQEAEDVVQEAMARAAVRWSPRVSLMAGLVTSRAAVVRLGLADGGFLDTPAVAGSESFPVKFFAVVLPYDADGRVTRIEALDGRGRPLCVALVGAGEQLGCEPRLP